MNKPDSLRALIVESVPELQRNPDRLRIWIRDGTIATRYGQKNHGWQYNFRLDIEVRDFSGHPDQVFLPIILWLRLHQPDALLNHSTGDRVISFAADYLDNQSVDLDINLSLTESVDVLAFNDGYRMTHRQEPGIAGEEQIIDPPALLKRIYDQDGKFLVGYPITYFLTGADGAPLLGADGLGLNEVNPHE